MPNLCPDPQTPQDPDDFDYGTLTILLVGNRCLGTAPKSPRKGKVRNCGHGLFHKMDKSQTADQDDKEGGKEAHRTSLKTSNGENPYNLTFESEVVIPAEIGMPTHQTMMIEEGEGNEEEMRLNLDLL
ncbi:hypothetical protein Tco_1269030 [Tanacetum coccineum]